jgi:hypothetical protein
VERLNVAVVLTLVAVSAEVFSWLGSLFSGRDSGDQTLVPTWLGFTLWSIAVVGLIATAIVVAAAG